MPKLYKDPNMKSIKNSCWMVHFMYDELKKSYYWVALTDNTCGVSKLETEVNFNTKEEADKNWLIFAKVNKLVIWHYAEK